MKTPFFLFASLLLASPARTIELSLEENRAERGSVGFVDMQRLFVGSPDAQRAKENFEELVRQAEERVNLKKAELVKLRMNMTALKTERDALATSTPTVTTPPPAPAVAAPVAASSMPLVSIMDASASSVTAPTPSVAGSTAAPKALALPGMAAFEAMPTAPSTATASVPAAAPPPPAPAPTGPTIAQRILELDGKIVGLQADIDRKEGEIKQERDDADKGLLDVENRKTDQVLARLYRAIIEVARKEGVSVVVDKGNILYGHPAVDLTDKVLKYLAGSPLP